MEETTGGRLIQNYYRIGGLQADIDPNFVDNVKKLCAYLRPMIQEYLDVFGDNVITHNRLEGVGPMGKDDCINYAVTGPGPTIPASVIPMPSTTRWSGRR